VYALQVSETSTIGGDLRPYSYMQSMKSQAEPTIRLEVETTDLMLDAVSAPVQAPSPAPRRAPPPTELTRASTDHVSQVTVDDGDVARLIDRHRSSASSAGKSPASVTEKPIVPEKPRLSTVTKL
jgi:hypothetical protein